MLGQKNQNTLLMKLGLHRCENQFSRDVNSHSSAHKVSSLSDRFNLSRHVKRSPHSFDSVKDTILKAPTIKATSQPLMQLGYLKKKKLLMIF